MPKIMLIYLFFISSVIVFSQRATIIKSPGQIPANDKRIKIFIGGSIDMGNAEDWQAKVEKELEDYKVILLNPRRDDWNKDWKPLSSDKNFRRQVEWELDALEASDIIIMYFAPGSQSPVSMLEFGLYARSSKLMTVCPDGFWRKGNIDIVSEKYKVKNYQTIDVLLSELKNMIVVEKK